MFGIYPHEDMSQVNVKYHGYVATANPRRFDWTVGL